MKTALEKPKPNFKPATYAMKELIVAGVLLVGLLVLGYGYWQQSKIAFYIGLAVTLFGVLKGVIQIVTRESV